MCQCNNGGCTACQPKDVSSLSFIASGKEIEELYQTEFFDNYSESTYVDPAESTPDA